MEVFMQHPFKILFNENLQQIILSNKRKKQLPYKKVTLKPFLKNHQLYFQFEHLTDTQAFHHNYSLEEAYPAFLQLLQSNHFKNMHAFTKEATWQVFFNKSGTPSIKIQPNQRTVTTELDHNRKKKYLLEEGQPIPYMIDLGIMTPSGKIVKKRYHKFKQINRFIEMVADALATLPKDAPLNIIDFGCGRSYLTFALYHYLVTLQNRSVTIKGLDLKTSVIDACNQLAKKCNYNALTFEHGDIANYTSKRPIDMVISLHACDTATDFALQKAVQWQAKIILSVPCCQHELNGQLQIEPLKKILEYGIIKERMAALITDAMRGNWLKLQGYEVQILEFIDVTHTPKNLLIRAIKTKTSSPSKEDALSFNDLQAYLHADLTIARS